MWSFTCGISVNVLFQVLPHCPPFLAYFFKDRKSLPDVVASCQCVLRVYLLKSLNQQADFNKNVTLTPLEVPPSLNVSVSHTHDCDNLADAFSCGGQETPRLWNRNANRSTQIFGLTPTLLLRNFMSGV